MIGRGRSGGEEDGVGDELTVGRDMADLGWRSMSKRIAHINECRNETAHPAGGRATDTYCSKLRRAAIRGCGRAA